MSTLEYNRSTFPTLNKTLLHVAKSNVHLFKKKEAQYHRLTYLQNKGKGKKAALESGIEQASGDLIVTTDADCSYSDKWLHALVEYFETYNPSLVIGPVVFEKGNSWFQKFQQLEFASLVGSGAGAAGIDHAIMCNGANLAFKKSEYEKLEDPFNRNLISGDDVFLLHNFKQLNASIDFIKSKDSIVQTKAVTGLKEFTAQRTRWTAKSTGYQDGDTLFVAIIVLVINAILFLSALLLVKSVLFWKPLIFLFVVKTLVDTLFFYRISGFFGIKQLLKWIPLFQFVYLIYVPLIGLFGLFSSGKNVTKM